MADQGKLMKASSYSTVAVAGLLCGFFFLLCGAVSPASAEPNQKIKAVLELFTSQGCSSCPPADRLLGTYQGRDDVIAMSLPVDYWDYLGWKDTLARPENTLRQRAYARNTGSGSVYTPEIVVNGVTHAVGSRRGEIEAAIRRMRDRLADHAVQVRIRATKDKIIIAADAALDSKRSASATIWLAILSRDETVAIGRGENHGRNITYFNVVREMKKVGSWDGKAIEIVLPRAEIMRKGQDACAALIQQGKDGPIIGAATFDDRRS